MLILHDYNKALSLCQQALALRKKVLGTEHPDYATNLNTLAGLYESKGEYMKALQNYNAGSAIIKNVFGEQHPDYANTLDNLGDLYNLTGQYRKALLSYPEALAIKKNVLGEEHPDYVTSLNGFGLLNITLGHSKEGKEILAKANNTRIKKYQSDILYFILNKRKYHISKKNRLNSIIFLRFYMYKVLYSRKSKSRVYANELSVKRNGLGRSGKGFEQHP